MPLNLIGFYFRLKTFGISFLIFLFLSESLLAKSSKKTVQDEDDNEGQEFLYDVTLDDTIETGEVLKIYKKKVIFKTNKFKDKIRKYNIFLVLSDDKTGVLAEIVVTKIKKKSKKAYAKLNRIAESISIKNLDKKPLIKMEDLRNVMGNMRIFSENPMLSIRFHQTTFVLASVNLLTKSDVSPVLSGSGLTLELFYPFRDDLNWLNWFGLGLTVEQASKQETIVRLPGETDTKNAEISSARQKMQILIQPVFQEWWFRSVFLKYGLGGQYNDTILVKNNEGDLNYQGKTSYSEIETGLTVNPVFNIYGGASYAMSQGGTYSLGREDSDPEEGTYSYQKASFWIQVLQPISSAWRADGRVSFDRMLEELKSTQESEEEAKPQKVTDWRFSIILGLAWSP